MSGRSVRRMTVTAATFMATSSMPTEAPRPTSTMPSWIGEPTLASIGSTTPVATAAPRMITRAPTRAHHRPVIEAAVIMPMLAPSSASPSAPSLASICSANVGMRGAHVPITTPLSAKMMNTGQRPERTATSLVGFCHESN